MTRLLNELLGAGWITDLAGDDSRWTKITQASETLAESLAAEPQALIGATLAGLDPNVPADDPAMARAERALLGTWPTMRSVHVDPPVNLLRALLLDASVQAAVDERGAIVWLTAADMLPLVSLGRAEKPVFVWLQSLADGVERRGTVTLEELMHDRRKLSISLDPIQGNAPRRYGIDKDTLYRMVAAAAGPQMREGLPLKDPNPYWPNQAQHWSYDFAPRLRDAIALVGETLARDVGISVDALERRMVEEYGKFRSEIMNSVTALSEQIGRDVESIGIRTRMQSDILWWSQALYSPMTGASYRRLPPAIAAVTMAHDLAQQTPAPCAASVGYLLAETTTRLPDVTFTSQRPIREWLEAIARDREHLPADHRAARRPPAEGRLSFDDLATLALQGADLAAALRRTALPPDAMISLPDLAHAIFHQRQARDLAERLS